MTVCKFFLQGYCRFGDQCRNEHPRGQGGNQSSGPAYSNQPRDDRSSSQRGGGRSRGPSTFGNHQVRFDDRGGAGGGGGGGRGFQGGDGAFNQGGFNQGGRGGHSQPSGFNQSQGFDQTGGRGRGRGQNNYDQSRQPPSGPRGRGGRGGFRGRNQNRQNDVAGPDDAYSITPQEILNDMTEGKEKPQWVCSCYAPGKNAPAQLIEGDDLEISPEELRYDFYLKMANGQNAAEEAANIERILSEEMSNRINAIGNDPQGAMQYVMNGINEHPNRFDVMQQYNPKPSETRWSQFTRDKQRRKQGVFVDQATPPRWDSPNRSGGSSRGGFGSNSNGGFGRPQGVGAPGFGSQPQSNGFGGLPQAQQTPGIFSRDSSTPVNGGAFGAPAINGGFARPTTPFAQQQSAPQDDAMLSPTRDTQAPPPGGFGQPGPGGFFSNPQPQANNVFGQPQQQASGFPAFGQPNSAPAIPSSQPNGTPAPIPSVPLEGPRAELKAAYDYMNQHGRFENGIMPETAPESDWIS